MRKVGKGRYKVTTPHGTKAKSTTKEKAKAQIRLLKGIEHNPQFKARVSKRNSPAKPEHPVYKRKKRHKTWSIGPAK